MLELLKLANKQSIVDPTMADRARLRRAKLRARNRMLNDSNGVQVNMVPEPISATDQMRDIRYGSEGR